MTAVFTSTLHRIEAPARFDVHEVGAFADQVRGIRGPVVVDLAAVRFIDVAGLNALMAARSDALELGHELFVSNVSQTARITLELAGLAEAFPLVDSFVEAA